MSDPVDYVPFETTTRPGRRSPAGGRARAPLRRPGRAGRRDRPHADDHPRDARPRPGLDRHAQPPGRRARRPAGQRQADRARRGRGDRRGVRPARHRGASPTTAGQRRGGRGTPSRPAITNRPPRRHSPGDRRRASAPRVRRAAAPSSLLAQGLRGQPHRAGGMVAYNLLLSRLPARARRAVRRRPRAALGGAAGLGAGRPAADLPQRRRVDAAEGVRRLEQSSTTVGHRRGGRPRSGSARRSGARWTPRSAASTTAVPHLGAPEAVRARDVRGRAAVLRGDRPGPDAQALLVRGRARSPARPRPRARARLLRHARRRRRRAVRDAVR